MGKKINMLLDVSIPIAVQLGQTRMTIRELLNLKKGSVVKLNRMAGEPIDIFLSKNWSPKEKSPLSMTNCRYVSVSSTVNRKDSSISD